MSQLDDKLTANDLDAMVHEVDAQGLGRVDVEGRLLVFLLLQLRKRRDIIYS